MFSILANYGLARIDKKLRYCLILVPLDFGFRLRHVKTVRIKKDSMTSTNQQHSMSQSSKLNSFNMEKGMSMGMQPRILYV
jgi:hypothetical protein